MTKEDDQDPPRSTALALAPRGSSMELATPAWALAQRIAATEFVPDSYRGKPETVLAAFLTAHELGVGPMQALQKIHVVKGRPGLAAELMRGLVFQHGHELWIEEMTATRVIVAGQRKGSDRTTRVTWTMDDAERAGLKGKDNWKQYPSAMLLARATAALCRAIFPDVLAGLSYTVEELEDGDVLEAELVPTPPEPGSIAATADAPEPTRARARRPATRGAAAPPAEDAPPIEKVEREAPPLPGEGDEVEEPAAGSEPEPGSDDDPVDAEIVEDETPPVGEGTGPVGDDETYEGPDETIEGGEGPGPSYSGPQIVSMKANDFGLNRDEKIYFVRHIVKRAIDSTTELTPDEVTTVLELFDDEEALEQAWTTALSAGEFVPEEDPEPPAEPKRTRRPVSPGPESWDATRWREFLRERGVKVAEVLSEASRLAREAESKPPTKLDEISESGLSVALVGFVEERAAERAK